MKSSINLFFLVVLSSFSLVAQEELVAPTISEKSGFYQEEFKIAITHEDPSLTILYTLDGSKPTPNHLEGKVWEYKNQYPILPDIEFGELLKDTLWTYEYSDSILVYDRTDEPSVVSKITTSAHQNGAYGNGNSLRGMVVRAAVYDAETEEMSEVVTKNYYITPEGRERYTFPVISLSTDNDGLYGYEDGINVPGKVYDEWREEHPNSTDQYWLVPGNFAIKGKETEKEIHFSYIGMDGEEKLNHNGGLRLNGQTTKSYPVKSLRLYARKDYGKKNFKYPFFKDYDLEKFKRLILRNGGNVTRYGIIADAYVHHISRNLNMNVQEYRPAVVFVNSDYNGIRNIRERYDKKYFKNKIGIEEEDLDFIKINENVNVKEGDSLFYNEMLDFLRNNNLSNEENLSTAIQYFDPINFIDYYITNIFVVNTDWLSNNYQFWRKRTSYNPEAEYGHDGRFRWNLQDDDIALGYAEDYTYNMIEWATAEYPETSYKNELRNNTTLMMRSLLENEKQKTYFINRFADLLNTTFLQARLLAKMDSFEAQYEPEIAESRKRWAPYVADVAQWKSHVADFREFVEKRPYYQKQNLQEYFDIDGMYDLVLNVNDFDQGYIHLNSIDVLPETDGIEEEPYIWLGEYFNDIPVTLTAVPKEGYKFSHWSGVRNDTVAEITLTLAEDSYLKAHFVKDQTSGVEEEEIKNHKFDVVLYPNPTRSSLHFLSDSNIENAKYEVYSIEGRKVQEGKLNGMTISVQNLENGRYYIRLINKNQMLVKPFVKS